MIPFAEISTKRSGGPFDISFSEENQNRKPYEPTTNSIKTTAIVRQQFHLRANAERTEPNQSPGKLVEASGTRRSRAAAKTGANSGWLAAHFRHHRHCDLWNSCRRAIRRRANVDRTGQARAGHFASGADLLAQPLHFHLPGRNRRTTTQYLRRALRGRLFKFHFVDRFCTGGVDFFAINRLNRLHGRAAFALLGDRHPFRPASD